MKKALAHPANRPSSRGGSEQLRASRAARGLTSWTGLAQNAPPARLQRRRVEQGWRVRVWLGSRCTIDAGSSHSRRISAPGRHGRRGQPGSSGPGAVLLTGKASSCNSRAAQLASFCGSVLHSYIFLHFKLLGQVRLRATGGAAHAPACTRCARARGRALRSFDFFR